MRYCDFGVIRFLKVFNAALFVTHVSAPGLPDMDERYAQEILAEEVSLKTNYLKMFLRNIKSSINIKAPINKVLDSLEIKMFAIVNKKIAHLNVFLIGSRKKRKFIINCPH